MPSRAFRVTALVLLPLLLAACVGTAQRTVADEPLCAPVLPTVTVSLATEQTAARLTAEVAESPADRERGLSGRDALGEGCGMLFRYAEPVRNPFWMPDMAFPLDIAFADGEGRISDVTTLQPCDAEPCPRHTPAAPYRFALEVNAGTFEELGIGVGDWLVVPES